MTDLTLDERVERELNKGLVIGIRSNAPSIRCSCGKSAGAALESPVRLRYSHGRVRCERCIRGDLKAPRA